METFNNPLFELEDMSDEVLTLHNMIVDLQQENTCLQKALQATQVLKVQLENELLLTQADNLETTKPKKTRDLSQATRAFMIYVNEQKGNNEFIDGIRTKMKTMGYDVHHRKNIPYQLLKLECDMKYGQLSSNERQKYMQMAMHQSPNQDNVTSYKR